MSLQSTIETELLKLFDMTNKQMSFTITDIDGNITMSDPIDNPMKAKIKTFSENLAEAILKLKVDLNTVSNPTGKLIIDGANGGGTVVWASTTQPMGGLKDN